MMGSAKGHSVLQPERASGGYAESMQLQSQTYHSVNTEMELSSYLNSIPPAPTSVRSS